ncbi:hypothetical protein BA190_26830 [Labrys sp. WJW]|uniref:hypothetical protein n=1 Tax=Labrys sp. WJW TaxID=1737983 RepID=UPI000829CDDA|nr:hypothetical protein [Labrys sp. WJW]OCC01830.1 hypothetical protein BA190_26830 [Labrys sp. WJW]
MCNACGFMCCAVDTLGGCGCDFCEDPDCWPEDDELDVYPPCAWCDKEVETQGRKAGEAFCKPCRGNLGVFVCEAVP